MSRVVRYNEFFRASELKVLDSLSHPAAFRLSSSESCVLTRGLLHSNAPSCFSRHHHQSQTAFQGTVNVSLLCATIFGHRLSVLLQKGQGTVFSAATAEFRTAPRSINPKKSSTLILASGLSRVPDAHSSKMSWWKRACASASPWPHRVVALPL